MEKEADKNQAGAAGAGEPIVAPTVTPEQVAKLEESNREILKQMNSLFQERAELNRKLADSEMRANTALHELQNLRSQPTEMDKLAEQLQKAREEGNEAEIVRLTALVGLKAQEITNMKQSMSLARRQAMSMGRDLGNDEKQLLYDSLFVNGDPQGKFKSLESMQAFLDDPDGFVETVQGRHLVRKLRSGELENSVRQKIAVEEEDRQRKIKEQVGITTGQPGTPGQPTTDVVKKSYEETAADEIMAAKRGMVPKLPHQNSSS